MATLPADVAGSVSTAINADAERFFTLLEAAESESAAAGDLLVLVDKRHPIPAEYEPDDLVLITEYGLSASRDSLRLRQAIIPALLEMDAAAKSEGIELLFSSAYRSYDYQATLFERYSAQYGEQEASRFSARPGTSQHQLGTAMDFGSIDDSFAATEAGLWLGRNAGTYGFSLSYPQGMENVTGYVWESWHYRYITKPGSELEKRYFGGVQQYFLEFLAAYRSS